MVDWHRVVEFFLIFGAAVMSPGPNFVMVVRSSASSTRKNGIFLTLGLGSGFIIQAGLSVFGLKILLDTYPSILKMIQYTGAMYLAYLGIVGLLAKKKEDTPDEKLKRKASSLLNSYKTGFFTQLLNPFATIFILSTFALFYDENLHVRLVYMLVGFLTVFGWYSTVSIFLTNEKLQLQLYRFRHWIDRGAGLILLYIAFKIGVSDITS